MAQEKPKFNKVVSHKAHVQKDSIWKKVSSSFFLTDGKNIRDYLIDDLLIPLIKKGISSTVDLILYGDANRSNRGNNWFNTTATRVVTPYQSFYSNPTKAQKPQTRPQTGGGFQNLSFDFRNDAEKVLGMMRNSIEQFGLVSAGDMYDMADVPTDNYMLNSYGWTDLRNARVINSEGGYVIDLPAPSSIK